MRHSSSYRIACAATLPEASATIADHSPANSAAITRALSPVGTPDLLASTLLGVGAPPPLVTPVAASDDGRHPHPPPSTSSADSQCVVTRTLGEWAHAPLEPVARIPRRAGARRAAHLVGVLTLAALALVLVGYCATAAFYYTSDSWIVPIVRSPHDDRTPVAVVPYGTLERASPGTGVYACRLAMLFCRRVGSVLELLPGEVTFEHPHRRTLIRGRLVELALDEPVVALGTDVLFVGGAPLWL
jgi:hypothetical protein